MKKTLVTGGAGFIGSHVVGALLSDGWEVVILDNLSTGTDQNVPVGAQLVIGDVLDFELLSKIISGCSTVFHLAAVASVQDSLNRPLDVHAANLTATLALLEASAKQSVKRFIFSSSASIYGDTLGNPAEENFKPDPLSHYAVQKLASENYCAVYDRLHGIETVCLRYFNVYGPRQRADSPYSGVIAKFTAAARNGMPLKIYGDGLQTRDFVHVNDVAYANLLSAKLPSHALSSRVFNVGSGKSISVKDLALEILKNFSGSAQIEYHQAQAAQIRFSESNISLAKKVLNYQPLIDLPEGIASLVA